LGSKEKEQRQNKRRVVKAAGGPGHDLSPLSPLVNMDLYDHRRQNRILHRRASIPFQKENISRQGENEEQKKSLGFNTLPTLLTLLFTTLLNSAPKFAREKTTQVTFLSFPACSICCLISSTQHALWERRRQRSSRLRMMSVSNV
jgi:hypothetical protein